MSVSSVAAGAGVLRALGHVTVRTHLGKLRRMGSAQRALLGILVVGLVALQINAITSEHAMLDRRWVGLASAGLCAVLAVVSVSAVRACPIRLRGADVAWLLPCPSGQRALVAWHVAGTAGRAALIGVAAAIGAALRAGGVSLFMWQPAVALTGAALLVRAVSYVTHLVTVHGVPRRVAGAGGALVWGVSALPAAADAVGIAVPLPGWVVAAGAPLRWVAAALVQPVLEPAAALWPGVLGVGAGAVAMAAAAVALATGYQDRAAQQTWEMEALVAAVREGSSVGAVSEVVAARLPSGVPSFDGLNGLQGEWALLWRAVAGLRRSWRSEIRAPLVLCAAAVAAAFLAPGYAVAPALPVALLAAGGFFSGFVEEIDHLPVRTLPGAPWRKVVAVDAVPLAMLTAGVLLVVAPAVTVAVGPWSLRLADLLAVPGVTSAAVAASTVSALTCATIGRRVLASALLVGSVYALALGAWTLAGAGLRGPAVLVLGATLAVACWTQATRVLGGAPW